MDTEAKAVELGRGLVELVEQASHMERLMIELVQETDTRNINDTIAQTVGLSLASIERVTTTSMAALKEAINEFRVLLYLKDFEGAHNQGNWRETIAATPHRKVEGIVAIRSHVVGMSLPDAVVVFDAFVSGKLK